MNFDVLPIQDRRRRYIDDCFVVCLDAFIDDANLSSLSQCGCSIESFTDPNQCTDFLASLTSQNVFCILNSESGEDLLPLLNQSPVVHTIYVICVSEAKQQFWTSKYPTIKGVFTDILPITNAIKQDVQLFYQNSTPITILSSISSPKQRDTLNAMFMYCQLLKETFLEMNHGDRAKHALVDLCKRECADNLASLRVIDEFDRDYEQHCPTWWYTRDCFVYRMLNKALRTHDIEVINRFGFFIKDLYNQLEELHRTLSFQIFTVYRGQSMSMEEFLKVKDNIGGLISFNSFLSTSADEHVSRCFTPSALDDSESKAVLFIIDVDLSFASTPIGFLGEGLSYFHEEQEYLWGMNTIFRINQVRETGSGVCQVHLVIARNDDSQLMQLTEYIRREVSALSGLQRLGNLMIEMGEWTKAKDIYETLLQEEEDPGTIQQLGFIAHQMNDFDTALRHYRHALSMLATSRLPQDSHLSTLYSNIGCVLNDRGHLRGALKQFERALELQRNVQKPDNLHLARTYNNIATVHDKQGRRHEALKNMNQALEILRQSLPPTHPEIAASLSNIATFYYKNDQYSNALNYYEQCFSIQQASLPSQHPDIIRTSTLMKQTFQRIELDDKVRKQSLSSAMGTSFRKLGSCCGRDLLARRDNNRLRSLKLGLLWLVLIAIVATSLFLYFLWTSSNSAVSSAACSVKWSQKGLRVAGGHHFSSELTHLHNPYGLYVDENQTVLVVDSFNNRIVEWKRDAKTGVVIAGNNREGNRTDQLAIPSSMVVDKDTDTIIICEWANRRVTQWSRRGESHGRTIIKNVTCGGLAIDNKRFLYVSDLKQNEVRRYRIGEMNGTVVTAGRGKGYRPNQLNNPYHIFIDQNQSIYVSDSNNHRVMKWSKGAQRGHRVAGGYGLGNGLKQLAYPKGVFVDQSGTIYVADYGNHRVMRWCRGAKEGSVIVGGNGQGKRTDQLSFPDSLTFDRHGNLYVSETGNHRVLKFSITIT